MMRSAETLHKFEQIAEYLKHALSAKRYLHTCGVVSTAEVLARRFSVDPDKARLAALLHDIAKEFKPTDMLREATKFNLEIGSLERRTPNLLHAQVGACIARNDWGVNDEDVLGAIACHTFGKPQMSILERIIFVADAIEPNRPLAWAEPIRTALEAEGLSVAVVQCCRSTIGEVMSRRELVHPMTVATYNAHLAGL